jgi:GntR family transcriptional regulator
MARASEDGTGVALDAHQLGVLLRRNGDGNGPLHRQLEAGLRALIRSGEVPAGTALPGEHDLAAGLKLSRHTIRHALGVLAAEGLVVRERGRGTRVVENNGPFIERSLGHFYAFAWEARERGVEHHSVVLELSNIRATGELARRMRLGPDRRVCRILRLRSAGGEPLVLETAFFPTELVEDFDYGVLEHGSVYDELERTRGMRVTRASEIIRPTVVNRTIARLLDVKPGAPALLVDRTTWSGDRLVEWQESLVRGDRFLYSVELPRA